RPFRADLSIKKSSSFLPRLMAATSHLGFAPRPAQVSPEWLRYFGGTFLPLNGLPPPRTALRLPTTAHIFHCFSLSARRSLRASSTRVCRSMSASTVIPDRFTFGIVISDGKSGIVCEPLGSKAIAFWWTLPRAPPGRGLPPWQIFSLATP